MENNALIDSREEKPKRDSVSLFLKRLQQDEPASTLSAEKSRPVKSADEFWERLGL